jgi:hypothetical protein
MNRVAADICARSLLFGLDSPTSAITATISRCGNSMLSAGGIDPARPTEGSPLMYGAFGSLTPYGGLYLI